MNRPSITPRWAWLRLALALGLAGCDGGAEREAKAKAEQEAKAQAEADAKAKEEADNARRVEQRKEREAQAERDYAEAKTKLDPLAKLPKKLPKSFSTACVTMLASYEAFMKKTLADEALTKFDAEKEDRERRMRRACHKRPVEIVACQTNVLNKAPPETDVDHIMRVCVEKFS